MKKILFIVILSLLIPCLITAAPEKNIEIHQSTAVSSSGEERTFGGAPFYYRTDKSYLYVPVDDIFPFCGAELGWDFQRNAQLCAFDNKVYYIYPGKNEVEYNGKMLWFNAPALIKDGVFYVSDAVVNYITGNNIYTNESFSEYGRISVFGGETRYFANGAEGAFSSEPYMYLSTLFLPMDEALSACGETLGWDNGLKAVVGVRNDVVSYVFPAKNNIWVGEQEYIFDLPPMEISDKMYISAPMLSRITGYEVFTNGTVKEYSLRDTMENTKRTDEYRLRGKSVYFGNGITVVDGFGMERVSVSESNGVKYAQVINKVAETLNGYNVYNVLVPTAAEFYAPVNMYPNQLAGMKKAYESLSDKVTPINVYDALAKHAGEKIYFATDHHWTQRGAYYAYREFIECKDRKIDDISTFTNVPSYNHVGSLARFASGTTAGNIIKGNPELLERFLPKYATKGTVFADQNRKKSLGVVDAVNTRSNSYSCFIGGDGPVTVFYTDAPSNESIVIIKESFGNAFATWAMHNYKTVCVIDPRKFNGFDGSTERFNLKKFCDDMKINDVVFINYPVAASSAGIRESILKMA